MAEQGGLELCTCRGSATLPGTALPPGASAAAAVRADGVAAPLRLACSYTAVSYWILSVGVIKNALGQVVGITVTSPAQRCQADSALSGSG